MHVWEFYKKPDNEENDKKNLDIEQRYTLYALTNKKEYADRFKEDRDMSKFLIQHHKHISREEYKELCNSERGSVLELHNFKTVPDGKHTTKSIEYREVLVTYFERQLLDEPQLLMCSEEFWYRMPFPLIFKDKYVEILNKFQYITLFKLFKENLPPIYLHMFEKCGFLEDDYSGPDFETDDVMVLIDSIIDTLK